MSQRRSNDLRECRFFIRDHLEGQMNRMSRRLELSVTLTMTT